ncbi:MAG: murein biosynthesis integral membrane protein MurJ [Gammaproteobacteria bacterium]|nr:murein biosynthesis integral membrane protein MurJ [Gammaproteobacteria bacterium]
MSKKLLTSGLIVSVMTLVSRVLGLVRDVILAGLLGASAHADVYLLAVKIPNFMRRLFAEGAFAQAFVPVLSEYQNKDDPNKMRELIAYASGTLGTIVTVVAIAGVIGSPILVAIFGSGWFVMGLNGDNEAWQKFELATIMLKITFPYLWFVTLIALSGSILNAMGRFAVSSFTPVFLNVAIIATAIYIAPQFDEPAIGLACGWFIGGLAQLLFQIPFLHRAKVLVKPKWGWNDPGVVKIRTLMIPALFGVSVSQINLLIDTVIATSLITGSVSWLFYSDRLLEFPLGLFGIAIATVILPSLSRHHNRDSAKDFRQTMDWAVRMILMMGLPAAMGLMILAQPLVTVLFMNGEFSSRDVMMASYSLMAYSIGLLSFMMIKVLAPGFYARQDTKTPVKIGIRAMVANMGFNAIFAISLGYEYGFIGLAFATSCSATCNAFWLYRKLKADDIYQFSATTLQFMLKTLVATSVMLALVYYFNPSAETWFEFDKMTQIWTLIQLIAVALISYFSVLVITGFRIKHLLRA